MTDKCFVEKSFGNKCFGEKCFIDTNILVYSFDQNDPEKMEKASSFLTEVKQNEFPIISVQTLGEFFNVTTKKLGFSKEIAFSICDHFCAMFPVYEVSKSQALHAMQISKQTQFSYWNSLILAVAIDSGCTKVYSEDLTNGQIVENVKIVNPFL